MMKKYVTRLLALVLVLCMVVPCVPVWTQAVDLTRPENISDEEWEVLRQKLLAELAEEQVKATLPFEETLPETDSLSKSEEGNLNVTDTVFVSKDLESHLKSEIKDDIISDVKENLPEGTTDEEQTKAADKIVDPAADTLKDQKVSVELPDKVGDNQKITNSDTYEYEATIGNKDAKVEEKYNLKATLKDVEVEAEFKKGTDGSSDTADVTVTDITYEISLDGSIAAKDEEGKDIVKSTVVTDVDIEANQAAKEEKLPEPQYKVDMTANGMNADEITRVEHKYTTPKGDGSPDEEHVEYYYNAKNGTEDTTKKYFTVTVVDKVKEGATAVKETVVSLWTSFLGAFHITTDAFEGAENDKGEKASYGSLAEANTQKEESVEMLRNYEANSTAEISHDMTLDLNGHKYTNTSEGAAIKVAGDGDKVTIQDGAVVSNGDGIEVSGDNNKFSLKNLFVRSNADNDGTGNTAAVKVTGSGNTVSLEKSGIDGTRSSYGVQDASTGKNTFVFNRSVVEGKTGVILKNSDATISGSRLTGTSGAALAVDGNNKNNEVVITSGRFESGKDAANIYAKDKDDVASITVKGGRFTDPAGLYSYIPRGFAAISHNDGSYFLYEVVSTDYTPTREGYYFLGYKDANGNPISLKEAYRRGVIAYAQWKEIPETTEQIALITVKTDAKGCTTKVIYKGDTAFVTVKDAKGEFAPISEVTIPSIKRLQNQKIDTVEIQVDEDVKLVLDIEKAKLNGFTDIVEVTLEKDMLLITSGKDTCIELNIAELKEADKPVEIQLVEGELTILLGKNSSMTVDLTKALKTGERIVVKLENGVLKLYDKYHKPIKE